MTTRINFVAICLGSLIGVASIGCSATTDDSFDQSNQALCSGAAYCERYEIPSAPTLAGTWIGSIDGAPFIRQITLAATGTFSAVLLSNQCVDDSFNENETGSCADYPFVPYEVSGTFSVGPVRFVSNSRYGRNPVATVTFNASGNNPPAGGPEKQPKLGSYDVTLSPPGRIGSTGTYVPNWKATLENGDFYGQRSVRLVRWDAQAPAAGEGQFCSTGSGGGCARGLHCQVGTVVPGGTCVR